MRLAKPGICLIFIAVLATACSGGGHQASSTTSVVGSPGPTSATPTKGAPSQAAVNGALLTIADLPAGFTTAPPPPSSNGPKPCGLKEYRGQATAHTEADFVRQVTTLQFNQLSDTVDALPPGQAKTAIDQVQKALSTCTSFRSIVSGRAVLFHVSALPLPRLDDQTLAVSLTAPPQGGALGGATIGAQFVVIRKGDNVAALTIVAVPTVDTSLTESLARKQAAKLASL